MKLRSQRRARTKPTSAYPNTGIVAEALVNKGSEKRKVRSQVGLGKNPKIIQDHATATLTVPTVKSTFQMTHWAKTWLPLIILSATQFVAILDGMLVNVALPAIESGLQISQQDLQWVVNAYLLVFGSFLMAGGRFADVFGSRRLFLGGMILFAVSSLLAGLAPIAAWLIFARILQGLAAAIISTSALALLALLYPEGPKRDAALARFWGAGGLGAVTGLVGGGLLTQLVGWRWIFTLNSPICLIVAGLGFFYLKPDETPSNSSLALNQVESSNSQYQLDPTFASQNVRAKRIITFANSWNRLDISGTLLITAALGVFVYTLSETSKNGWFSPLTLGLAAVALVLALLFIRVESRIKNPMLDFTIFRSNLLVVANVVTLLFTMCIASTLFLLALYLQQVLEFSALSAGLALLPFEFTTIIVSTQCGRLIGQFGLKRVMASGLTSLALGLFWLAFTASPQSIYLTDILPGMLLFGYGLIASLVPLTIGGVSGVNPSQIGIASGLINSTQQLGNSFGLALLSSLATGFLPVTTLSAGAGTSTLYGQRQSLAEGCQLAFGVAGCFALLGLVIALKFFGRPAQIQKA